LAKEEVVDFAQVVVGTRDKGTFDMKVYGSMQKIATFINFEFFSYHTNFSIKVVMEKLMGSNIIKLHLPHFYLPPTEVKV
jgi:hypothetical protein